MKRNVGLAFYINGIHYNILGVSIEEDMIQKKGDFYIDFRTSRTHLTKYVDRIKVSTDIDLRDFSKYANMDLWSPANPVMYQSYDTIKYCKKNYYEIPIEEFQDPYKEKLMRCLEIKRVFKTPCGYKLFKENDVPIGEIFHISNNLFKNLK